MSRSLYGKSANPASPVDPSFPVQFAQRSPDKRQQEEDTNAPHYLSALVLNLTKFQLP